MNISRRGACSIMVSALVLLKRGLCASLAAAKEPEAGHTPPKKELPHGEEATTVYQYDEQGRLLSVTEHHRSQLQLLD